MVQVVQVIDVQRHAHALLTAEGIDEHGHAGAFHVLKQQGFILRIRPLGNAVGDLGDLQFWIHLGLDAHQFIASFQRSDVVSQIAECHGFSYSPIKGAATIPSIRATHAAMSAMTTVSAAMLSISFVPSSRRSTLSVARQGM